MSDKAENGKKLSTLPYIERVKARLIEEIDSAEIDFYENNKDKIIFAIAVNETECWLLTLFDIKKGKLPIENSCLHHLNQHLENSKIEIKSKKGEYEKPIDPKKKDTKQYERLSDRFADDKDLLLASAKKNPSFQLFIADLTLKTN